MMESLRLIATTPINQRVNLDEDVTIGDYVVPKGVIITIPNWLINRTDDMGPNPEEFHPERFMGNSPAAKLAKRSWSAFGKHSRMVSCYYSMLTW